MLLSPVAVPVMNVGSLAVGSESRTRIDELVETKYPDPGVPNRWIFDRQGNAPEFIPVLGARRENETGVIARVLRCP